MYIKRYWRAEFLLISFQNLLWAKLRSSPPASPTRDPATRLNFRLFQCEKVKLTRVEKKHQMMYRACSPCTQSLNTASKYHELPTVVSQTFLEKIVYVLTIKSAIKKNPVN